jgi:hypothetical protein
VALQLGTLRGMKSYHLTAKHPVSGHSINSHMELTSQDVADDIANLLRDEGYVVTIDQLHTVPDTCIVCGGLHGGLPCPKHAVFCRDIPV